MTEAPLITYFLTAYRQERFVEEAVAGALSQTYSPLEIILSDDCSPDGTFALMEAAVKSYRGPHKVILNRNPRNVGITEHVNKCVELSSGRLIVGAAGDDISLPNYVSRIVEAWMADGCRACSIFSNTLIIDAQGKPLFNQREKGEVSHALTLEEAVRKHHTGIAGCSHAFDRKTFEIFGPLHKDGMIEDNAIGFRSLFFAPILYVDDVLVKYREHGHNIKHGARARICGMEQALFHGWMRDLEIAREKGLVDETRAAVLKAEIQKKLSERALESRLLTGNFLSSVSEAATMLRQGNPARTVFSAFYRSRIPRWVKRSNKFLTHDLFHPRDLLKSLIHSARG